MVVMVVVVGLGGDRGWSEERATKRDEERRGGGGGPSSQLHLQRLTAR